MKFKTFSLISFLLGSLFLTGCDNSSSSKSILKVGVISGSELEIAELAGQIAKQKYNLDVEIIPFNDFIMPNEALAKGDIDVNAFQHKPYLDQQIKDRNYKLAPVAKTFVYPIAGYSKKIKNLNELKDNATIAIPNDPTNLARSLLLLQKQGLIKVDPSKGLNATVLDITDNPRHFTIIELEAPQLPRTLDDPKIDLAIINTVYASQIGLTPTQDGLFVEDKESPYVNLIVARSNSQDDEKVKQYVESFQDERVFQKATELFNGGVVKGW